MPRQAGGRGREGGGLKRRRKRKSFLFSFRPKQASKQSPLFSSTTISRSPSSPQQLSPPPGMRKLPHSPPPRLLPPRSSSQLAKYQKVYSFFQRHNLRRKLLSTRGSAAPYIITMEINKKKLENSQLQTYFCDTYSSELCEPVVLWLHVGRVHLGAVGPARGGGERGKRKGK